MSALNLDLVDALLDRPDLGPEGLDLAADLLREAPEPPGCRAAGFDGIGACEDLANVFDAVAGIMRAECIAACTYVLRLSLVSLVEGWTPVLIWLDGPAGLRPGVHEGVEVTAREAWRARLTVLLGERGTEEILTWVHGQRLRLAKEIEDGEIA